MTSPHAKILALLLLVNILLTCQGDSSRKNDDANLPIPPSDMEDNESGSIEIPVRKQRSGQTQHRPIVELVLGVLDTIHSSTKSELKRIMARQARQLQAIEMTTSTTTESSVSKLLMSKLPTPRKRLVLLKA